MAAISRTNSKSAGHGYSHWFQPPAESKRAAEAGGSSTDDKAGTIRLVRVGSELQFHAGPHGQPSRRVGAVTFGDHRVESLAFQVLPQALKAPIDVEFDNIAVKADRITGLIYVPPSAYGYTPWMIAATAVVALAMVLWWWSSRKSRQEDS